jgi:hypothetical protein
MRGFQNTKYALVVLFRFICFATFEWREKVKKNREKLDCSGANPGKTFKIKLTHCSSKLEQFLLGTIFKWLSLQKSELNYYSIKVL